MAEIAVMRPEDVPAARELWAATEGLTLRDADSPEALERYLAALHDVGIEKCHLFVRTGNQEARCFWEGLGWTEREDIVTMSVKRSPSPGA